MTKCTEVWFSCHNKFTSKKWTGDNPYNCSGLFSRGKHWWHRRITIIQDGKKYLRHHTVIIFLDMIKTVEELYKIIIHETLHHVIHHINSKLRDSEHVVRLLSDMGDWK